MSFKIDRVVSADIPRLVDLLNALFTAERDFTAHVPRQQRGLELLIAEAAKSDRAIVAVVRDEQGKAVGMASAQLVISTAEGAPSAWIEDVIVDSEFRGRGLGRLLIEHLLAWAKARGATRAQLLADNNNLRAALFYDALGWQKTQLGARRRFIQR